MGAVRQSVHGRVGHDLVGEKRQPIAWRAVGGDNNRAPLVALSDDLVELLGLGHGQGGQAEVIYDQQVRIEKLSQGLFPAAIGASRVEVSE